MKKITAILGKDYDVRSDLSPKIDMSKYKVKGDEQKLVDPNVERFKNQIKK